MKCSNCGNRISAKARFCDACGSAVERKKATAKDWIVSILFLALVVFLISLFFPGKKKEAPAAVAPASAPVASTSSESAARPTLSAYSELYLKNTAQDFFGPNHSIEVVADKEIIVTIWQDGLTEDVSAMKSGDADASAAWHDLRDAFMTTSKQITASMREVSTAGSYCTIFLVNESDHADVFLIVSNGMLYYDVETDGSDSFFIYKRADQ